MTSKNYFLTVAKGEGKEKKQASPARKATSRSSTSGKRDGSIFSTFPRRALQTANTKISHRKFKDDSDEDPDLNPSVKTKPVKPAKRTKIEGIDEDDFDEEEDNVAEKTRLRLQKARANHRKRQKKAQKEFEREKKEVHREEEPEVSPEEKARLEHLKNLEEMRESFKKVPTRAEWLTKEVEDVDDGKNDIEFTPVGYNDAYKLDLRRKKVARQVRQHAVKQKWPVLTRDKIIEQITAQFPKIFKQHIAPMLKKKAEKNKFYTEITTKLKSQGGASNSTLLMYLGTRMYSQGYFSEVLSSELAKFMRDSGIGGEFEQLIKENKELNEIVAPSNLFHFQTAICVPETAIRMIMSDLDMTYAEADAVRLRSAEWGILLAKDIADEEREANGHVEDENDEDEDEDEDESESETGSESEEEEEGEEYKE